MHKNAQFLLKNCKNRPTLGATPPDPYGPPVAGQFDQFVKRKQSRFHVKCFVDKWNFFVATDYWKPGNVRHLRFATLHVLFHKINVVQYFIRGSVINIL